jgi:glycosyltransferase involved in cell wall biosynthesis
VCTECADHHLLRSVRHGCYRGSRPATAAVAAMIGVHRALATWRDKVDVYIALSEFARRTFVAAGLPAENVAVKPNFVAPDPGPRTGTGDYALFVGRLSPEKGLPTMLEAWRRLGTRVPLEIIGDGPEREALQMAAAGLAEVRFRGRLPREETLAAMKGARCLVFPSQWYEGLPMTIIEAFACGVPVIASRLGTMAEVVADGRTGLHFTPGDAADLADRIDRAWSDPQAMEAMGAAARAEFESRYTLARNHEMLMSIYARAIATLARTARPTSTPCFDRGAST